MLFLPKDKMKVKNLIKKIPPIGYIYSLIHDFFYWRKHYRKLLTYISPGHFYSPLPDIDWVLSNVETLYPDKVTLASDIDMNEEGQKTLLCELEKYIPDFNFPKDPSETWRYYHDNDMFGFGSGIMLFGMIRHFQPKRIIEIGSGHTSALMLDTNERFMNRQMELTFIEPNPERLHGLLKDEDRDRCTIFEKPAQEIPASYFQQLQKNDILFIDSSHVTKIGSDVNYIFFNILPLLNPGVIIHFHDIYWPFEYPLDWIEKGLAWNEAYLLRAFLQYNEHFEIIQFNQYLWSCLPEFYKQHTGLTGAGGSIWIRKKQKE